jgi:hypothetical protein
MTHNQCHSAKWHIEKWQLCIMTNKQYNVTLRSMTFSKMNCQQCHNLFPLILSITSSTLLFKMSFNWVPFCRKLWHPWSFFLLFFEKVFARQGSSFLLERLLNHFWLHSTHPQNFLYYGKTQAYFLFNNYLSTLHMIA